MTTSTTELIRLAEKALAKQSQAKRGWLNSDDEDWKAYIAAADPQAILGLVRELAEAKANAGDYAVVREAHDKQLARAEKAEAERDGWRSVVEHVAGLFGFAEPIERAESFSQIQCVSEGLESNFDIAVGELKAEASDLKAQVVVLFQCITKAATLLDQNWKNGGPRSLDAAEFKIVIGDLLKSEAFDAARAYSEERGRLEQELAAAREAHNQSVAQVAKYQDSLRAELSRIAVLEANQRTPGTVEKCRKCDLRNEVGSARTLAEICEREGCPIRTPGKE